MRKVIINAYTEQNLGDDLFIKCLCDRYPTIKFYLYCKECYSTAFKTISNLIILNNKEDAYAIKFDFQIIIGGSIFMQSINKSILKKYHCDKKMKIPHIPTYVIGVNFGPYKSKTFFLLYKHWFKSIKKIVFRDRQSYELFSRHSNNTSWAPDILFNYNLPNITHKNVISISCIKKNMRSGLSDYDENAYIKKLAEIAETYSEMGFSIILSAFSKVQEDDIAANMVYSILTPKTKLVTDIIVYQGKIDEFLEKFLSATYIIGTRFHSIILGWHANIPTFPICYNDKLKNAIISYAFNGNYTDISMVDKIEFSYIDSNRKNMSGIDNKEIAKNANNHFFALDSEIKGE